MNRSDISIIRPMNEDDIAAVLKIENESFSKPWQHEHFQDEITSPHSFPFVAETGGIIVGYICIRSLFEEAEILDIAVAPEKRGIGIAGMLICKAIKIAAEKGAEMLVLEVRASNICAITLYKKNGFIRTGLRKMYYEGKEDAVLMERRL